MPGFFSLEAAKAALGVTETVAGVVAAAEVTYETETQQPAPLAARATETLWSKVDHLLYLPLLGLKRPRELYYYQGEGLQVLYGFTYKYLTVEHFLGQLTRLQVGYRLADALAATYVQAHYPTTEALYLFADWHVKPHWTKSLAHAGHVTMWGRTMPGTRQLILNGPDGFLLGGWNYAIDTHMSHILVDLEATLTETLSRPIACTIVDGEAGGQPVGERYAAADRHYLTVLSGQHHHSRADFLLLGPWQTVIDDPQREAAFARWADATRAAQDPRHFVLLRLRGQQEPSRIYTGLIPADLPAAIVPWLHRQRWPYNELRIRDLVNGANLNENYGYTYDEVTHRTRQRHWQAAQVQVEVTQSRLADQQEAVRHLRRQLQQLQSHFSGQHRAQAQAIARQRQALQRRQASAQPTERCRRRLRRHQEALLTDTTRFRKRQRTLLQRLHQHQNRTRQLQAQLSERMAIRDAIDTQTLCRQRHLEKDQIMLNLQILLANLHDHARQHYFAPEWQHLTLATATQLIYGKSGQVTWHPDRIEVGLAPYRYREHQQAMVTTCHRFNQANLRWRDGRLLRFSVRPLP